MVTLRLDIELVQKPPIGSLLNFLISEDSFLKRQAIWAVNSSIAGTLTWVNHRWHIWYNTILKLACGWG